VSDASLIRFGPFRLLGRHGPLLRDDREIKLQPKALAVLWRLASQPGELVTRTDLLDAVWPGAVVVDDVLSYQIKALRQAIEDDPRNPRYILTAHRVGFRLVIPSPTAPTEPSSGLIGRDAELRLLRDHHELANQGRRQFVFLCGEAGMGKTMLLDALQLSLRNEAPATRILRGHCLEVIGESEAYRPIFDALESGVRGADGDQWIDQLRRSAPSWLRQLPQVLAPDEVEHLQRITAGVTPEQIRRELAEALEGYAAEHPLVLMIEDLHWSDASTVALLGLLAQRDQAARLSVICTCRPVETILNQHPTRALQLGLTARGLAQTVFVEPLQPDDGKRLVERRLPGVSAEQADDILRRSGGHPLFLVQLTDYLQNQLTVADGTTRLDDAVPPRLRELVQLQLSQLTVNEQLLLEVAAVAGQDFAAATVAAGSGVAVETVEEILESLALRRRFISENGLAIWPDGTASGRFQFRHALYGQVLRQRLGQSRSARVHRRLAQRLELAFGARASDIAADLAYHYDFGGVAAKAAEWRLQTAQNALERVAPNEVHVEVARGLALLEPLAPDLHRHRIELSLRVIGSYGLWMERGYRAGSADEHSARIETLIDQVGDDPIQVAAVTVQWTSHHFNLEFERAIAFCERVRELGRKTGNLSLQCAGLGWAAHSVNCLGEHEKADAYAADAYRLALATDAGRPAVSADAQLSALGVYALTRWYTGFPEQALAAANLTAEIAERSAGPYLRSMLICSSRGVVLELVGDYGSLKTLTTDLLEQAHRYGHRECQRWARLLLGIAQLRTGDPKTALQTLQDVLDDMRRYDVVILMPMGLVNLARAWWAIGQPAQALPVAEQALAVIRERGQRPWEPEALRTIGELKLKLQPRAIAAASALIEEAVSVARSRKSLSMELRAATSLARLRQRQGRTDEALALIESVLGRFTEGFDFADQRDARALITSLRG
jgi:DNA-binding winged helix-turn-helix (wHTH) protein/tetratricopeptide (TPR) repeat protein